MMIVGFLRGSFSPVTFAAQLIVDQEQRSNFQIARRCCCYDGGDNYCCFDCCYDGDE